MVSAVGTPTSPSPVPAGAGGDVQAQLAQVESQLADCVNCSTASTAQGRARIALLTARVQALKARLVQAEPSRSSQPAAPPRAPGRIDGPGPSQIAAATPAQGGAPGGAADTTASALGTRLDVST